MKKSWTATLRGAEFRVQRLQDAPTDLTVLDMPESIIRYLKPKLAESLVYRPDVENLVIVHLNTKRHAIGFEVCSTGTIDTLLVHPREVFKAAIVVNAHAIVLLHNHPSGDPTPSDADVKITRDLVRAGQLMKIEVLDHLVLGTSVPERVKDYTSLRELGYFY